MNRIKRILGLIMLLFAAFAVARIPRNWESGDTKWRTKVAADVLLILVCGGGGAFLLRNDKNTS